MAEKKPLIALKWRDHTSIDDWQKADGAVEALKAPVVTSVGWLLHEDDDAYYIFGSYNEDDHDLGDSRCILKGTVIAVIRIPMP